METIGYHAAGDLCLGFWAEMWSSGSLTFPLNAKVLEVGCAEADWQTPMLQVRPDLNITGIDTRLCGRPGETICGDVLTYDFPPESFDAIVSVSAIEHVGLGGYGDPVVEDGDTFAMQRLGSWLKPGGWIYLDVPYRPDGPYTVHGTSYRAYDERALWSRLIGPSGCVLETQITFQSSHPDAPYAALLLTKAQHD